MIQTRKWIVAGLAYLAASTCVSVAETPPEAKLESTARERVDAVMATFAEKKALELDALAKSLGISVAGEFRAFVDAIRNGTPWGEVHRLYENLQVKSGQYESSRPVPHISNPLWSGPILELGGGYEHAQNWNPKFLEQYADLVLKDLPKGSIFFAGTDSGRFVSTLFREGRGAPDIFIITQNALADNKYMGYLRATYGTKLALPSEDDVKRMFQDYASQVQSGDEKSAGNITIKDGKVSVNGVQAVMRINARLSKWIFENNRDKHDFFLEESYVIPWMYPHLAPHGAILKLHAKPVALTPRMLKKDRKLWQQLCRSFFGNREWSRDVLAQKSFSKLRCALGGVYTYRRAVSNAGASDPMTREAEFAFRQAIDLYPMSPEASFRLADLLLQTDRIEQARAVMVKLVTINPGNERIEQFIDQIDRQVEKNKRLRELEKKFTKGSPDLDGVVELLTLYGEFKWTARFDGLVNQCLKAKYLPMLTYVDIAKVAAKNERRAVAERVLKQYVSRDAENISVWLDLAEVQERSKKREAAIESLGRAVDIGGTMALHLIEGDIRFAAIRATPEFKIRTERTRT